ncbi:MAG: hypothetical protein U9P14_06575 [Gemmatimonadota bacterium]|nr:hypothetical protein [Gemmatimonadota bacterium]
MDCSLIHPNPVADKKLSNNLKAHTGCRLAILALAAGLLIGTASCSDRERANPFDPNSPNYGLEGLGFNALAGNEEVLLYWDRLDYYDLAGFDVLRVCLSGQDTVVLNDSILPPDVISFIDPTPENDVSYAYSLRMLLTTSDERPVTMADIATPGLMFGWMIARNGIEVWKMTPDFRDKLFSLDSDFLQVEDIQVRPPGKTEVWVLDGAYKQMVRFHVDGTWMDDEPLFRNTTAFLFNQDDKSLWVASDDVGGIIYHFNKNGALAESFLTGVTATSLAINFAGTGVWIGTSENRVLKVHEGKVLQVDYDGFSQPRLAASGIYSASAWVLDTALKQLFYISGENVEWEISGFVKPSDITVNSQGTICWMADPGADILYEIDLNGQITAMVKGLGQPDKLTFAPEDNTIYVSGRTGKVSKVAAGGTVIWQRELPFTPGRIALQQSIR